MMWKQKTKSDILSGIKGISLFIAPFSSLFLLKPSKPNPNIINSLPHSLPLFLSFFFIFKIYNTTASCFLHHKSTRKPLFSDIFEHVLEVMPKKDPLIISRDLIQLQEKKNHKTQVPIAKNLVKEGTSFVLSDN